VQGIDKRFFCLETEKRRSLIALALEYFLFEAFRCVGRWNVFFSSEKSVLFFFQVVAVQTAWRKKKKGVGMIVIAYINRISKEIRQGLGIFARGGSAAASAPQ